MANDYYQNLPTKRMSALALYYNEQKDILIVKPNYADYWLLPGGVIEKDESPLQAIQREIQEEIGLEQQDFKLVVVDYVATDEHSESIKFLFIGGDLAVDKIKLDNKELSEFKYVKLDKALMLLHKNIAQRIETYFQEQKEFLYIENGQLI
ncbi:MAG: hypothetical protein COX77_03825 [Candidatus Komeilibacteria bacterium CG_4_10_14_0_2_um_filter_37_10]|uniref:Nudix hydrolase domain-containing protein n=1 Tax=Candidatus Komeilibacteria bacterium CG_4_10_14_0_2_um_filter_37_10 TaxID=1974470 RepID=A0A2M7VDT1_9BACT|nr:MAG: hypothetical protein COX77_03825 [Candidatus Komeilibacteria bacterium CG_4_10_14_0_2_um_filter_37_10]PJA94131.1 MAG: hypothetical protein CO133_00575 [Candidatus Komeilibacteria bacterium CG_4_9_14_3_um_filter_37_5]